MAAAQHIAIRFYREKGVVSDQQDLINEMQPQRWLNAPAAVDDRCGQGVAEIGDQIARGNGQKGNNLELHPVDLGGGHKRAMTATKLLGRARCILWRLFRGRIGVTVARVIVTMLLGLVLTTSRIRIVLVMRAAPENGVSHEREERDEGNDGAHRTTIQAKGFRGILLYLRS